jgi:hypothetical protein
MTPLRHAVLLRLCERDREVGAADIRRSTVFANGRRPFVSYSTGRAALEEAAANRWFRKFMRCNVWFFEPLPRVSVRIDLAFDYHADTWHKLDAFGQWWFDPDEVPARIDATPSNVTACFGGMDAFAIERYRELAEAVTCHLAEQKLQTLRRPHSRRSLFMSLMAWKHRLRLAEGWSKAMSYARHPNKISAPGSLSDRPSP